MCPPALGGLVTIKCTQDDMAAHCNQGPEQGFFILRMKTENQWNFERKAHLGVAA